MISDSLFEAKNIVLEDSVYYRWGIRAFRGSKWSSPSNGFYFILKPSPVLPLRTEKLSVPLFPGSISDSGKVINTIRPEFKWSKMLKIKSYYLTVSKKNDLGDYNEIYNSKGIIILDTSFILPPGLLKNNEQYRWTINSLSESDSIISSKVHLFFKIKSGESQKFPKGKIIENKIEEIYVTLQYADYIKEAMVSYYLNNKIFIPINELFSKLEINNKIDYRHNEITGFYLNPDKTYTIDLNEMNARINNNSYSITKDEFIKTEFAYSFNPSFYKKVFGIGLRFHFPNLTVIVDPRTKTPLSERISREKSYNYLLSKKKNKNYKLFNLNRSLFDFGYLDYNLSSIFTNHLKPTGVYTMGLGGEFLGGDLQGSTRGDYSNGTLHNYQNDYLWRYVFPENKYISSASLGSIGINAIVPVEFKGIQLSNNPVTPRTQFATYKIYDKTHPNWTVEIYVDNVLIDYVNADAVGNFSFNVPIDYGNRTIQLKFYGPNGEFYTENKFIQIPFYQLRPNEFIYSVNIGKQNFTNNNLDNISLGYGISKWLTNKVEMEYLESDNNNKPVFYNSTTVNLGGNNLINLTLAPDALYKISTNTIFYSQTSLNLEYTKFIKQGQFNLANNDKDFYGRLFLPFALNNFRFNVQTNFNYLEASTSKTYNFSMGTDFIFSNLGASLNYNFYKYRFNELESNYSILDLGLLISVPGLSELSSFLNGNLVTFLSSYNIESKKFQFINLSLSTNLSENIRLQITHTRNFLISLSSTQLQLVFNLPFTTFSTSASSEVATQNITGSMLYNKTSKELKFARRPQIGRSAITFKMFIDENGNGKFDDNEPPIEGAFLQIGSSSSQSDKEGIITAYDLNPYTRYDVRLREEKLKNPLLVTRLKNFSVIAAPNSVKYIDIPFYIGGEIDGSVTKEIDSLKSIVRGIKVYIINLSDSTTYNTTTYSDGSFYVFGIIPGNYEAYVDKDQASLLGLKSDPPKILFEIKSKQNGDIVNNLNFILKNN